MRFLSRDGRVSPLTAATLCALLVSLAAVPALAESRTDVKPVAQSWAYGQPSMAMPDTYHAHFALGQELMQSGNLEGAAREFLECIHLFQPLVSQRERRGDYRDKLAMETDVRPLATASVNLGHALRALDRLDTAIKLYTGAADLSPGYVSAHESLGRALIQKGSKLHVERASADTATGDLRPAEDELNLYRSAIAHLHVARQLEPDNASVLVALSNGLRLWGVLDASLGHARRAAELDPTNPQAHYALGMACQAMGRLEGSDECAIDAYREAARLATSESDAFQAEIQNQLALSLAANGDFDDAVVAYRKAALLQPANATYQNNLGAALRMVGKAGESAAAHANAAVIAPEGLEYWLNLAASAREAGDLSRATTAYYKAMRINCTDAKIHYQLGLTLLERSQPERAIVTFDSYRDQEITDDQVEAALARVAMHFISDNRLRLIDAMDPRAYEVIPRLVLRADRWGQMRHELLQQWLMLDQCPLYGDARLELQNTILQYDKVEPAILRCAKRIEKVLAVKMGGSVAIIPAALPDYMIRLAREESPMAASVQVLAPEVKLAVMGVALMLQQVDDLQEATAELEWASRLDRNNPYITNDLGKALMANGKLNTALSKFRKATRMADDVAEMHYNGGMALASLDQVDKAMEAWECAKQLNMSDPKLATDLGIAYLQMTEIDYAYAMFARAVQADDSYAPAHYYLSLLEALKCSASPITRAAVDIARIRTPFGKASYDVRAEFIKAEALTKAVDAMMAADKADPDRREDYYYVGVELALQDPMLADVAGLDVIHAVSRGLGFNKDWATVTNNVAAVLALKGNLDKAEDLLRIAIADEPNYALAHWNLGRVLMLEKKEGEAKQELDTALKLMKRQNLPYAFELREFATPQYYKQTKTPRLAVEEQDMIGLLEAFNIGKPVL